ncbi:MAG: WD40 repeat domain-containing protein, partial [Gemmataceae bacterium]
DPSQSVSPWRTQPDVTTPQSILPLREKSAEAPTSILPWRDKPMDLGAPAPAPPPAPPPEPANPHPPAAPPAAAKPVPSSAHQPTPPPGPVTETDDRRQARKIAVLEGHRGWVTAVVFSPNRGFLVSGGVDGTLRFWDLAGTEPEDRAIPNAHASDIGALAFAPDSKVLASGAATLDGLIWLWDLPASNQARTYIQANRATIDALTFSPDGKILAGGGSDKLIRLWDIAGEPRAMTSLKGHNDFVTLIAFAPDGKLLASASRDETVRLWNPGKIWSKEQAVLEGHWGQVFSLAFARDGQELAFGSLDQQIYIWDLADGKPRARAALKGHEGVVRLVHYTSDGRSILSVCDAGKVIFWEADTKTIRVEWQLPRGRACSMACTHDGRYLATGNSDGTVSLFRLYDSMRSNVPDAAQSKH